MDKYGIIYVPNSLKYKQEEYLGTFCKVPGDSWSPLCPHPGIRQTKQELSVTRPGAHQCRGDH